MRAKVLMTGTLTAAMSLALLAQGPPPGGGRGAAAAAVPQTPPLIMTIDGVGRRRRHPRQVHAGGGPTAPSPELKWSQVPTGTQSFVLLMHDPEPVLSKGSKMDITHWLIWNIPGTSTGLPEGVAPGDLPDGTRQVSLRSNGYMGPGAPPGPYHHYTFKLYALDTKLDIPSGTPADAANTRTAIEDAMDGHVLGKAVLVARFHRQ